MKASGTTMTLLQAGLALSLIMCSTSYAQPIGDTVGYTERQAVAGRLVYERNCASCHGINLEGAAVVPNLSGAAFAA